MPCVRDYFRTGIAILVTRLSESVMAVTVAFFYYVFLWVVLVGTWSGWLDGFLRESGLARGRVYLWAVGSALTAPWHLPVDGWRIGVGLYAAPLLAAWVLWARLRNTDPLYMLAAALLVGMMRTLLLILLARDPVLAVLPPEWLVPLAAGTLAAFVAPSAWQWVPVMLLAYGVSEPLWQWWAAAQGDVRVIGNQAYADGLAVAVATATMAAGVVRAVRQGISGRLRWKQRIS